jgi:hypothetical protein
MTRGKSIARLACGTKVWNLTHAYGTVTAPRTESFMIACGRVEDPAIVPDC